MKKAIRRRGVPQEILSQLQLPLSELIRQTLLDTVITSGTIQAIEMLRSQQEALCGPRYKQVADRKAHRHGSTAGSLVMGGRRVTLPRPRVRSVAGREVELPAWTQWSREDPLEQRALQQMILGVSTRGYSDSLEKLPVEVPERGKSRSAVSRRFVEGTRRRLVKLQRRDLSKLSLAVLMIDGIHSASKNDGKKHVLGLWEGATENSRACKALLENLASRGLQTNRSMLIVLDGAKDLADAADEVVDRIRCPQGQLKPFGEVELDDGERLVEAFAQGGGSARMLGLETRGESFELPFCALRIAAFVGLIHRPAYTRPHRLRQVVGDVPLLVLLAALDEGTVPEDVPASLVQSIAAREALARRPHDASMVWCCSAGCRAALPPYQGLPRDAETDRCPQSTRCRT